MAIPNMNPDWLIQRKGHIPQARVDWIASKHLDLPYAPESPLQSLDIYLPEEERDVYPVIINVHGGGFVHCDKRDFHLYPTFYALKRGYAVAAVNYRLSPGVRYPEHLRDTARALSWLGREGGAYRLDTGRAFLWGTSAGGNIVLHLACKQGLIPRTDSLNILATAAFCPLTSLDTLKVTGGPLMKLYAGIQLRVMTKAMFGTTKPSPAQRKTVDVANYLSGGITPVFLQHGTRDPALPFEAARDFAGLLKNYLPEEDLVFDALQDARHAGDGADFFLPENVGRVLDFFDRKGGQP